MSTYYQNNFQNDLIEEFAQPMAFNDMNNVNVSNIINGMKEVCEANEIPADFYSSEVEISQGLFRKATFHAVEVSHPNPPQQYYDQLYVIFDDGIRFYFVGNSAAISEKNNYDAAVAGTGGDFKAKMNAMIGNEPDPEPYEKEMEWHGLIFSVFKSLLE